jgi:hypothetical protein
MRKCWLVVIFVALLVGIWMRPPLSLQLRADNRAKDEVPAPVTLKVGDTAPELSLLAFDGKDLKKVSLADYHGKKNVALAFYVFAFTGG